MIESLEKIRGTSKPRILGVKHSGQLGDIVYSLPAAKKMMSRALCTHLVYFIPNDTLITSQTGVIHFGKEKMVTQEMFDFIRPLLMEQDYVYDVIYLPTDKIPSGVANFDVFRNFGLNTAAGSIRDYFFKSLEICCDNNNRWIQLKSTYPKQCDVVLSRSRRYLNNSIDYSLLSQFPISIGFIGADDEVERFKRRYPKLQLSHLKVDDACHAAKLIEACDLFIGNQSFFFSIAEGLQKTRLLECFEPVPNVICNGGVHGSFTSTNAMLKMVSDLIDHPAVQLSESNAPSEYLFNL